jgi:hypothetical protein
VNTENRESEGLTKQQRELVRANIGLVAVHLRRHVANLATPRRDREWEDLFQEGCVGLIQAAAAYRSERGIPFAAFALPRIHNAVSEALRGKFSIIPVSSKLSRTRQAGEEAGTARKAPRPPRVHSLRGEPVRGLPGRRDGDPHGPEVETVGDRLRGKYERAVRLVANAFSAKPSRRGDLAELVRLLTEERLLIPEEESRRALRQIARDTNSSYARVAQYDRQLCTAVRGALENDPEYPRLMHHARVSPQGASAVVDDDMERDLAAVCAEEFVRRFRDAPARKRASMLDALLQVPCGDMEDLLRQRVSRLSTDRRESLLHTTRETPTRLRS